MSEEPGRSDPGTGSTEASDPPTEAPEDRPATYGEVFGISEFRAVFSASALSAIGDNLGKLALTALMYQATGSVLAAAAGLAVTYLPWLVGAPFLVALAERYPHRRVMLGCDVARMALVGIAAVPGIPILVLPVLMFLAAMISPPFASSRSALLPSILSGDRYVLGLSITGITAQAAQIGGFAVGGVISAIDPHLALVADAATFGLSGLLVWLFVRARPATPRSTPRGRLVKETLEGFSVVFGSPVLRPIAVVILSGAAFAILPEGLATGWAHELHGGRIMQGLIMAAEPVGVVIGGVVIGRMVAPSLRRRLIRPLAMLVPLSLVGALAGPPLPVVLVLAGATGFAMSVVLPANGLFVQALPDGYRARAFGVMQGGLQLVQGGVIVVGGAVAEQVGIARTVGVWALVGCVVMASVAVLWPKPAAFDEAFAHTKRLNAATEAAARAQQEAAERASSTSDRDAQSTPARRSGPIIGRRRTGRLDRHANANHR